MALGNILKVLSANCQGLQNYKMRKDVLDYLDNLSPSIICLQFTHWLDTDMQIIKQIWNTDCLLSYKCSNFRGVAILLNRNFKYKILPNYSDQSGNYIVVNLEICKKY